MTSFKTRAIALIAACIVFAPGAYATVLQASQIVG